MGLSDEADENTEQRFEDLCLDLNLDKNAKEDAWHSYQRIRTNFTLEGDQLHWLACALYEACRRSVMPTVNRGTVQGNCVSLTRILRSARFSLIQFFNKMKKWSDMASLPQEFRDKVDRLERNFAVSTVIFKKFEPIFLDIFRNPLDDQPRHQRSRKQRRLPCTVTDVFKLCWTVFIQVKGHFPAISDDLVNSYHLLLCCMDWMFSNALLGGRKDLLNQDFTGLPATFHLPSWRPPSEVTCIIQLLCEKHEGLVLEAKGIKEHWWKPHIKKLFEKKQLRGKLDSLSAVLEIGNYEINSKAINHAYEEYVLSVGDFDERIFLGDDAEEEIGTPGKLGPAGAAELADCMLAKKHNLRQHFEQTRSLTPSTPLTGRGYLKEKEVYTTPVSTATQSVSRLQALLSGRKTSPSEALLMYFNACSNDPHDDIIERVKTMGDTFCTCYCQPSEDQPGSHIDFAKKRLQLAESLYYKVLESIVIDERRRLKSKNQPIDLTALLKRDIFHRSLFACSLEIVIFSYNSQRTFPWIVDMFELNPYYFYKVIELLIRAEEGLSRDVVKHLNHVEESILESLAWRDESPLWDAIKDQNGSVPTCEEVSLPCTFSSDPDPPIITGSPLLHPVVKKLVLAEGRATIRRLDPLQSPTGPSATDRFLSPTPGSAKRRLFGPSSENTAPKDAIATTSTSGNTTTISNLSVLAKKPVDVLGSPGGSVMQAGVAQPIIAFQHAQTEDGRQVLIPVQTTLLTTTSASPSKPDTRTVVATKSGTPSKTPAGSQKARRTDSLALFFRKVYHMANLRLRDLSDRLDLAEDLRQKIWTCFEQALTVHAHDLMMGRHIDQILMCAIYVISKVTSNPQSFTNIMKCYRYQPQAQSHVYRSVLLSSRRRHTSGSSEGSRNGASRSSSPTPERPISHTDTHQTEREKKRAEMCIRSTSTLPVPNPNSQPPTPTPSRMAYAGGSFEFGDERGDLITFYNKMFVVTLRTFVLKFSNHSAEDCPPLSVLPPIRSQPSSPRRVSSKYSVYISPHKCSSNPASPSEGMRYSFNKSPSKDLRAINNMIRMGEKRYSIKRSLPVDQDDDERPAKAAAHYPSPWAQRLQGVSAERREANGGV